MTFIVNGIKQDENEKHSIEVMVCVDATLLARKIFEKTNILIIGLKEWTEDKVTFGDVYFSIKNNTQIIEVITKYKNIQDACNFFVFVGFDLVDVNSYSQPISQKESAEIIANAQAAMLKKKSEVWEQIRQRKTQEKKVYEDAD